MAVSFLFDKNSSLQNFALCSANKKFAVVPDQAEQSPHKRFVAVCGVKLKAVETTQIVSTAFYSCNLFFSFFRIDFSFF